jgi:diguanylate cyclase (GGDEF)-like protein/PAS domain S-box-containing protein
MNLKSLGYSPFATVAKVALVILGGEFAIMIAIEGFLRPLYGQIFSDWFWNFLDPVLLSLIVAPVLYLAVLRPMKAQKKKLELQKDELGIAAVTFDAHEGVIVTDENHRILKVNQSFTIVTGYTSAEATGQTPAILSSGYQDRAFYRDMREVLERDRFWQGEIWNRRKNGEIYPEWLTITAVTGEKGKIYNVGIFSDITRRKQTEEALRQSEMKFRTLFDSTSDAVQMLDEKGFFDCNKASLALFGYASREELCACHLADLSPPKQPCGADSIELANQYIATALKNGSAHFEWLHRRADTGKTFSAEVLLSAMTLNGKPVLQATVRDITERKQSEMEIHHLAFYDALTRLPNRRLLLDRLATAQSVSARSNLYGAILFLDMDRFKTLNDTLGHDYGDLLLIETAERLISSVREVDTIARFGGDEFVVLLEEIDEQAETASRKAAAIAEKIRIALAQPYQLKAHEYHSSPSIGVSLYRGHQESVDTILKHADMAMYQAKDSGRNAIRFFDPSMQLAVESRASLEADLRHIELEQQLHLYYQIQVDEDHRTVGAETLIRWIHPKRGMVAPAQFIPIAEESELILVIGNWVLDKACKQLGLWTQNELTRHLTLAVNVSAQQFKQHDFVQKVATALHNSKVDTSRLKLELTESVVLNDLTDVIRKMHALKALGVRLSLDDFGTGYSSLSYLKQLPLDQIKIDQSFVRDMTSDPNDAVMVETIIDMARNFRLNVIAEGVETQAQLSLLKHFGCMDYQGYYFGKPVPIAEFEKALAR